MSASLSIPFALGVQVWRAVSEKDEKWEQCPECCGQKFLTLTLGNGAQHTVDCGNCSLGYDPPRGIVRVNDYSFHAEPFTPTRVTGVSGSEVTYTDAPEGANCYTTCCSTNMFATKEEAEVDAAKRNAERAAYLEEMALRNISSKRRDLAWSVSYWRQEVKKLEADLERACARLDASLSRKRQVK